jgi:mono/diheme cytochrome c family protein
LTERLHMRGITLLPIALVIFAAWLTPSPSSGQEKEDDFAKHVAPFLKKHCIGCHGPAKQEGDIRFDGPLPDLVEPKLARRWFAVKRMISQGEMPPEEKPRPTADELTAVIAWIDSATSRAATVTRGGIGRRALRRLTAKEYLNTLHDLLGLSFPHALMDLSERLPSDAIANRFSNDSNLQVTQTLQLRRSLDLAEDLLTVALPDAGTVRPMRYHVDLRPVAEDALAKYVELPEAERKKSGGPTIQNIAVPSQLEGGEAARLAIQGDRGDKNRVVHADHLDPKRGVLLGPNPITFGVNRNAVSILLPFVPDRGVLRLIARAGVVIDRDDSWPVLRLSLGGPLAPGNAAYPIAEVVVTASADAPREYVLEVPLLMVDSDWASFRREKRLFIQIDNAAALLGPTPVPADFNDKQKEELLKRNRLLLESFTLEIEASPTRRFSREPFDGLPPMKR